MKYSKHETVQSFFNCKEASKMVPVNFYLRKAVAVLILRIWQPGPLGHEKFKISSFSCVLKHFQG